MEALVADVRLALRGLMRRKAWAGAVLITLALGIGAATGLFSVTYSILSRPLPYPEPDRLVRVHPADPERGATRASFSMPDWEDWRRETTQLAELGLYSTLPSDLTLTGRGDAQELETAYVSSGFFEVLGVDAVLGRVLLPDEERGDNRVVVLSHGVWQRVFGADPGVVGTTVELKSEPYRVVGVMPEGFGFPTGDVELYVFLTTIPASSTPLHLRVVRFLGAVGRLAPGATVEQARSDLSRVAEGLSRRYPDTNESLTAATVVPLRESIVADIRPSLLALMAGAGLFLLAALANVSGLTLVRQLSRTPELAVRESLGAGRGRLMRQAIAEAGVVAVLGTVGGLVVAGGLTRILLRDSAGFLPRAGEVSIDGPVLAFAAILALLATAMTALLPIRALPRSTAAALRGERDGGATRPVVRGGLVAAQIGLATVVLLVAALMVRSLQEMSRVDPGFDPERRLMAMVNISSTLYPERSDYLGFYRALREELSGIPGVERVGAIRYLPTRGMGEQFDWALPGVEPPSDRLQETWILQIDEGLPDALGMRVREGRALTQEDAEGTYGVLVNQTLRRAAFGDGPAVGRMLDLDGGLPAEVVGIVDDVRQGGLGEAPEPTVYMHQEGLSRRSMAFVLHTAGDPLSVAGAVRDRLRALDADQPLAELTTADQLLEGSLARPRLLAGVSAAFGLLSTLLALVAAGGAVAHAVGRRTREIGIRVALGERPTAVSARLLAQALVPVGLGVVGGVAVTLSASRFLRGVLFGVAPWDWAAMAAAIGILTFFSLLACFVPARRAGAIDPVTAMRAE